MSRKKTTFKDKWLLDAGLKWLARSRFSANEAFCTYCHKTFALSNMGKQALTSHAKSKNHQSAVSAVTFEEAGFAGPVKLSAPSYNSFSTSNYKVPEVSNMAEASSSSTPIQNLISTSSTNSNSSGKSTLTSFVSGDVVARSEIIFCISSVLNHHSFNSSGNTTRLFPTLFPDSNIAAKIQLQKSKIAYSIVYGIAPYFQADLVKTLKKCDYFTVGFDESLNKYAQKSQMDIHVTYWCSNKNEIVSKYLTSAFLRECKAIDLLSTFQEKLGDFNLEKIFNLSMDGPNVNLKFVTELERVIKEQNPRAASLIFIGSCGLHVSNNSFKEGMKVTGWNIKGFLLACYYLFHNSPARKALYLKYGKTDSFPAKFCSVRWLENSAVATKAIKVLPAINSYVEGVEQEKIAPDCKSYKTVKSNVTDPLLEAKLCFFIDVAFDFEDFLRKFQSESPMSPFLYGEINLLLTTLMKRFVKPSVLEVNSVSKIDLKNKSNFLRAEEINLSHSTKDALKKVRKLIKDKDIIEFRTDCQKALIGMCTKLTEKSPLKYRLTRGISFLDPSVAKQDRIRDIRFNVALDEFVKTGRLSATKADIVQKQFRKLSSFSNFKEILDSHKVHERLDQFWLDRMLSKYNYMFPSSEMFDLIDFIKMILHISHGNANLERGFSVNKECLIENLREESLVALRQIYCATKNVDLTAYDINKTQIMYYRNAHSSYTKDLKDRMESLKEAQHNALDERRRKNEIDELQMQKRAKYSEICAIDEKIEAAKKKKMNRSIYFIYCEVSI